MSVQWTNYNTLWSRLTHSQRKQCKDWNYYYDTVIRTPVMAGPMCTASVEQSWLKARKPYYRIYPTLVRPFLGVDLRKVQAENLTMPLGITELLIQLPMESAIRMDTADGSYDLDNILVAQRRSAKSDLGTLIVGIDGLMNGVPSTVFVAVKQVPGRSIEYLVDEMTADADKRLPKPLAATAFKIVCLCLLLRDDPQLISPEVLADDQNKWDGADVELKQKLLDRAKRRGKVGWAIGRDLEVNPHYRRPHLFLAWTGKGRAMPQSSNAFWGNCP